MKKKYLSLCFIFSFLTALAQSPSVSITSNAANNSFCPGDSVTFTANSSNASSPSFQWYKNGTAINGETGTTFTTTTIANNDVITVNMILVPENPTLISNGLIQFLNANDSSSYNGSGNTWNDISGNNNDNDGSVNPATFVTSNSFSYFDLQSTAISAPVSKSQSMTFTAWAKTNSPQGMLFNSGPDGQGPDLFFDNNQICWNVWDSFSSTFNVSTSIIDTAWHSYTVVVNSSTNNSKLYFDGVYLATGPYHISSSNDLFIGGSTSVNGSYFWNGFVSSFNTYNRVLSDAEVLTNHNALSIATYSSNSITMTTTPIITTSSIKLSTGASTVTSLTSNLTWAIDNTLNDDHSLFQITSGYILSFINPAVYGQNNIYTVSTISGCNRKNITVTISPYCGNWNKGGDGLTQSNPGTSAYQIKSDHPSSVDGLYWISNTNINSGTPFQIYADMTTDGGGWTLIMKNSTHVGWTYNNAISLNTTIPFTSTADVENTSTANYSIIGWADYIKKSNSGFQYMMDAGTRISNGGIWTANANYSFTSSSRDNTNITLNTKFGNWEYYNDGLEERMPWYGNHATGAAFITTSGYDGGWWGTLITDAGGWTSAPWIANRNGAPGIIWYWVR